MTKSNHWALYGAPERGKGSSSRPPRGRLCDHSGCTTVLSTYNPASTCWSHAKPQYRHALER